VSAASRGASLELRMASVRYGQVIALEQVSLRADAGAIVALIGANGAGKSSALRAISGLSPLAAGQVLLDGEDLAGIPAHARVARGVAMVPEGRHVFPYMSIRDNLMMGAYTRGSRDGIAEDLERVMLRFPRLRERYRQSAASLSGGEQQMVAVGRALMARPRVLLLDEPSLGIAPLFIRQVARTILEVNREEQVTVLLVEQNSRLALTISHYAYLLATGRVELEGPAERLRADPEVQRIYLGA
jgi:branched-chain amino acid transport system ATP-binding protein